MTGTKRKDASDKQPETSKQKLLVITAPDMIEEAIRIIEKEQEGKGECRENRKALNRLKDARDFLNLKKG